MKRETKYQTDYQNCYFGNETYFRKCEECINHSVVIATPACPDYHTCIIGDYLCCAKYVCKDGCTYYCGNCGSRNTVRLYDGYMLGFKCYNCKSITEISTKWWGNSIMSECDRHCGCPLNEWNGFVDGTKCLKPDQNILKNAVLDELKEKIKTKNFGLKHVFRSCTVVIEEGSIPLYIEYFDGEKTDRKYYYIFNIDPERYQPSAY